MKNQKRRKRTVTESDWQKYWGSNKVLIEDVKNLGEDKFSREILRFCRSKGECNYWEAKYQMLFGVLESDAWYNDWILCKVHRSHVKKK